MREFTLTVLFMNTGPGQPRSKPGSDPGFAQLDTSSGSWDLGHGYAWTENTPGVLPYDVDTSARDFFSGVAFY
jgi:hypothetical protein